MADERESRHVGGSGNDTGASADCGTYTLVIELPVPATAEVGALGPVDLAAGWYAYTGSAFGPGGFGRVDRHRELAAGERHVRHWHVDYLLGHPESTVDRVVRSTCADVERAVSRRLVGDRGVDVGGPTSERVPGFGASDCGCDSHLAYAAEHESLLAAVESAHDATAGSDPYLSDC